MAKKFVEVDPRGKTPFEVGLRDLRRYAPLLARSCSRGMIDSTDCAFGMMDGRRAYYNLAELNKGSAARAAYVIGHENLHLDLEHMERMQKFLGARVTIPAKILGTSGPRTMCAVNCGTDLIIAERLRIENRGARAAMIARGLRARDIMEEPEGILVDMPALYNPAEEDLSSEELVPKLLKQFPESVPEIGGREEEEDEEDSGEDSGESDSGDSGESGGESDSGDSGEDSGESDSGESDSGESGGESGESDSGDSGDSGESDSGESGEDSGESDSGESGGDYTRGDFGGGHDDFAEPDLEEGETLQEYFEEIREENRREVYEARLNEKKNVGTGSGLGSFVYQDTARTYDPVAWQEHLGDWFRRKDDEKHERPLDLREFRNKGIVRKARGGRSAGDLVFLVDTSGSNVDKVPAMLDKVQEVLDLFAPRMTYLVPCDDRVQAVHEIPEGGRVPESLEGGGGTLLTPALEWARDNVPHADGIIYLTDGYTLQTDWQSMEEPERPLLWLCFGHHREEDIGERVYPFGERVPVLILPESRR